MKAASDKKQKSKIDVLKSRKTTVRNEEKQAVSKNLVKNDKTGVKQPIQKLKNTLSSNLKLNLNPSSTTRTLSSRLEGAKTEPYRTYKKDEIKKALNQHSENNNKINKDKTKRDQVYYESDFESDEDSENKSNEIELNKTELNKIDKKIKKDLGDIKKHEKTNNNSKLKRPGTNQINKLKLHNVQDKVDEFEFRTELEYKDNKIKDRAKELLDIITLNTVEFELVNLEPIDYKDFMETFGQTNTKQIEIQSVENKDAEVQLENQVILEEKMVQTSSELTYNQIGKNYCISIDELFRLKKFLYKAENILNQLIKTESDELIINDLNKFGQLIKLDYQFSQLITFHRYEDSTFKQSNSLVVFWHQNQIDQLLYCREKVSSNLCIENGVYILGTENGTILIYDLTNKNQIKSNLNLPNLRIDGVKKDNLISCSYSTLFLNENLHKSKILKLSKFKKEDHFKETIRLISLDEIGKLLIWNLEKLQNLNLSLDYKFGKGMSPLSRFRLNLIESFDLNEVLLNSKFKFNHLFSTFEQIHLKSDNNFNYLLPVFDQQIIYFEDNTNFKKSFRFQIHQSIFYIGWYGFNEKLFLTASTDGTITLFDLTLDKSIYVWHLSTNLVKVNWLNLESYFCFVVLDSKNKIQIYDLNQKLIEPVQIIEESVKGLKILDFVIVLLTSDEFKLYIGYEDGKLKKVPINKLVKMNECNYTLIKLVPHKTLQKINDKRRKKALLKHKVICSLS